MGMYMQCLPEKWPLHFLLNTTSTPTHQLWEAVGASRPDFVAVSVYTVYALIFHQSNVLTCDVTHVEVKSAAKPNEEMKNSGEYLELLMSG